MYELHSGFMGFCRTMQRDSGAFKQCYMTKWLRWWTWVNLALHSSQRRFAIDIFLMIYQLFFFFFNFCQLKNLDHTVVFQCFGWHDPKKNGIFCSSGIVCPPPRCWSQFGGNGFDRWVSIMVLDWKSWQSTDYEFRKVWEKVFTCWLVFTSEAAVIHWPRCRRPWWWSTGGAEGSKSALNHPAWACFPGALVIDHFEKKVKPITITNLAHGSSHFSWICMALARNQAEPALGIWIKKEHARSLTPAHSF